jgi:hypothetical protein
MNDEHVGRAKKCSSFIFGKISHHGFHGFHRWETLRFLSVSSVKSVVVFHRLLEYRKTLWDKKIAVDARAGKLDSLIKKAKACHRTGKATPFP